MSNVNNLNGVSNFGHGEPEEVVVDVVTEATPEVEEAPKKKKK